MAFVNESLLQFFVLVREHAYRLYKSRPLISIRKNFFSERVINVWNALPADVDFTSLPRFRSSILKIDLCSELKRFWFPVS